MNRTVVDIERLRGLLEPVLTGLGYQLVELEWKHESGSWVLRLFIDAAAGIAHEDCVRVSRAASAELDVADPIGVAYHLEVSSPGLNRPLRTEADFRRYTGQRARIRTRNPVGDATRRNFKGTLLGADGGEVRIDVDGKHFAIPVAEVEKANLEFEG